MTPRILDHLPTGLLDCAATQLHQYLSGPTVIHLPGERLDPLVVCVLQHGNETSGWEAIRRLLRHRYSRDPLPRSLILLIGNVEAAQHRVRHLQHQPDLNRCWPGSELQPTEWHDLLASLTQHIKSHAPFASIDIHNNTGKNPHYAAVNTLTPQSLQLASEFSKTVVFFTKPTGVQSQAFAHFCPAITLECGLSHEPDGADHALAYLDHILRLPELPNQFPAPGHVELYQVFATLTVAPELDFCFCPKWPETTEETMLVFPEKLDEHNFTEWSPGFPIAKTTSKSVAAFRAIGDDGRDLTHECFYWEDHIIRTKRPLMPAMLTADPFAVRHDCLCYLMERVNIEQLKDGSDQLSGHTRQPQSPDQGTDLATQRSPISGTGRGSGPV